MHCRYAGKESGGETWGSGFLLCPMCGTIFPTALCSFAWGLACLQLRESHTPPLRLVSSAAMHWKTWCLVCLRAAPSPLYICQKGSKANALAKHLSPCRSEHQVSTVLCLNCVRYITVQMLPKNPWDLGGGLESLTFCVASLEEINVSKFLVASVCSACESSSG